MNATITPFRDCLEVLFAYLLASLAQIPFRFGKKSEKNDQIQNLILAVGIAFFGCYLFTMRFSDFVIGFPYNISKQWDQGIYTFVSWNTSKSSAYESARLLDESQNEVSFLLENIERSDLGAGDDIVLTYKPVGSREAYVLAWKSENSLYWNECTVNMMPAHQAVQMYAKFLAMLAVADVAAAMYSVRAWKKQSPLTVIHTIVAFLLIGLCIAITIWCVSAMWDYLYVEPSEQMLERSLWGLYITLSLGSLWSLLGGILRCVGQIKQPDA